MGNAESIELGSFLGLNLSNVKSPERNDIGRHLLVFAVVYEEGVVSQNVVPCPHCSSAFTYFEELSFFDDYTVFWGNASALSFLFGVASALRDELVQLGFFLQLAFRGLWLLNCNSWMLNDRVMDGAALRVNFGQICEARLAPILVFYFEFCALRNVLWSFPSDILLLPGFLRRHWSLVRLYNLRLSCVLELGN